MLRSFSLLALAACSLFGQVALAAPPERLELSSNSSCPSAADVVRELTPLLQHTEVIVASGAASTEHAEHAVIRDEGVRMRVKVGADERTFSDPERACSERARASAVFIGLVLDPPLMPEAPPPVTPAAAPASPVAPLPVAEGPHLTLELGPLLEVAPISDAVELPVAGGFGSRLAWGRKLSLTIGAAFLLPTRLELPAADARLVWLPFDVSLRASQALGALTVSGDLGPELALLFASGDRVANPRTSTRLEVGARAALSFTWGMSQHLGAFFTLLSVWRPRPYEFRVNPDLASGTTPPLWLGASLGLSLRTR